jgi:diguanylate cyclase
MLLENSYFLMFMAFIASIIACFASFGFVEALFRAISERYLKLLFIFSAIIGIGLLLVHAAAHSALDGVPIFGNRFSLYIILCYLFAFTIGVTVLDVSNKKKLPIKSLVIVALQTGFSSFGIFYFYELASIGADFSIMPIAAIIATMLSMMVGVLSVVTFFWIKKYSGPQPNKIKTFFASVITVGIFATHIAFNAAILTSDKAIFKNAMTMNNSLSVLSALVLVFVFLTAFILVIFYDKINLQADKKLNFVNTVQGSLKQAFDPLTKLPNRDSLNQHLNLAAKRCERIGDSMAIAYIDLDHFKPVNDNFGHHVGDLLLIEVANRFNSAIRNCDYIARTGGDEFVAILGEINAHESIVTVVQRIVDAVKEPFYIEGHLIEISCSVGVAIYPRDGNLEKLKVSADAAMYKAKESGRNQYRFYDAEIEQASDEMQKLRQEILHGLEKNEFMLHFQPKVDSVTQAPVGAEALLRWKHPVKGLLTPIYFIEAAERFGFIEKLNTWVIVEACKTIFEAKQKNINLNISVNLSRQQFRNPMLVDYIKNIMAQYNIPPQSLIFELSETHAIHNQNQFKKLLSKFKIAKLKVSIDDFGLHPFSLTYLQNLEVSEVKLDKSFTSGVAKYPSSLAIVDAVVKLAHALNLNVVAEGVESEEQCKALATTGCDQMQGYYFSKPIPKDGLYAMFKSLDDKFNQTGQYSVQDYQDALLSSKQV